MSKYKIGDKVRCIDQGSNLFITKGVIYKVVDFDDGIFVKVIDDNNTTTVIFSSRFELVEETPDVKRKYFKRTLRKLSI